MLHCARMFDPLSPSPVSSRDGDSVVLFLCSLLGAPVPSTTSVVGAPSGCLSAGIGAVGSLPHPLVFLPQLARLQLFLRLFFILLGFLGRLSLGLFLLPLSLIWLLLPRLFLVLFLLFLFLFLLLRSLLILLWLSPRLSLRCLALMLFLGLLRFVPLSLLLWVWLRTLLWLFLVSPWVFQCCLSCRHILFLLLWFCLCQENSQGEIHSQPRD